MLRKYLDNLRQRLPHTMSAVDSDISGADNYYTDGSSSTYLFKLQIYDNTHIAFVGYFKNSKTYYTSLETDKIYIEIINSWLDSYTTDPTTTKN
jgi:hypothetical protein